MRVQVFVKQGPDKEINIEIEDCNVSEAINVINSTLYPEDYFSDEYPDLPEIVH